MRREYVRTLEITRRELDEIEKVQDEIAKHVRGETTKDELEDGVKLSLGVLSVIFAAKTYISLAAGVVNLVLGIIPSDKNLLLSLIDESFVGIRRIRRDMGDADLVRVKFAFLEFVDEGFRMIQGRPVAVAYKFDGKWIF